MKSTEAVQIVRSSVLAGSSVIDFKFIVETLHVTPAHFWFPVGCIAIQKGLYLLHESGIKPVRNKGWHVYLKAVNYLSLLALWITISLLDLETGHWRPVIESLPVLLAVGVLVGSVESVLHTTAQMINDRYRHRRLSTLRHYNALIRRNAYNSHKIAQIHHILFCTLVILSIILVVLLYD